MSPFFASAAQVGVLPGEERAHPAYPFWRLGARVLLAVPAYCSGCNRRRGENKITVPCSVVLWSSLLNRNLKIDHPGVAKNRPFDIGIPKHRCMVRPSRLCANLGGVWH